MIDLIESPEPARVTLVTAPAGYGKSTLVAQWAAASERLVAWIALGPDSNNPARFRAQLAAAIDTARPDPDAQPVNAGSLDEVATAVNALVRDGAAPAIVLDDLHLLENPEALDAIDGLLVKLHEDVRVILISRATPPLPLARLRADGAVREITATDLAFTLEETRDAVDRIAPDRLSAAQVATLESRTDGWIAGIRLALSSLDRIDPASVQSLIDTWPAARQLDDYIVEEVLATLPDDVRAFVLRTVFLPELTPDLCNAVLDIETSAELIEAVRRQVVFVRPTDHSGESLAYHALFAESAGRIADRQFPAADRRERGCRAARWYEQHGRLEVAIEQAVAIRAWELTERCAKPLCRALMDRDDHQSRLFWLRKLPEDRVLADPEMARWYISALQYSGRLREAKRASSVVEPTWQASGDPVQLGHAAATRCFFAVLDGDDETALELAHEVLTHYGPDRVLERMHGWAAVHQIEFRRGNGECAEAAYRQAAGLRELLPAEQAWWTMQVQPLRANHQALWGNLQTAHDLYDEMLATLPAEFGHYDAKLRARLVAILLEWNDLPAVPHHLMEIERGLEVAPSAIWHMDVLLVLAQAYDALGDADGLANSMHRLRALHRKVGGTRLLYRIEALQVAAWLESGKLGVARDWLERTPVMDQAWVGIFGDNDPRLAAIQVILASGQYALADHHLQAHIDRATSRKLSAEIVPLSMWQVVTRLALDDDAGALASLRIALHHGMRGRFVRSFRTPGYLVTPFLQRLSHTLPADEASYASRVLAGSSPHIPAQAAVEEPAPVRPTDAPNLVTPLSGRELEVLRLVHAGCTNLEIAEQLFVTERTVKKHVSNVLRKLDVPNRTAAVLRGQELGLL